MPAKYLFRRLMTRAFRTAKTPPIRKRPGAVHRGLGIESLEERLAPTVDLATGQDPTRAYGQLPLSFEVNVGQTDPRVQFLSRGGSSAVFLTPGGGAVLNLRAPAADPAGPGGVALALSLVGGNPTARATGLAPLAGTANYLTGDDPGRWHTNVATYAGVGYEGVYPGVDLVYYSSLRQLEYDFRLASGADPGAIRFAVSGADAVTLDGQGNLVLHTAAGDLVEHAPVSYQEVGGVRVPVTSRFVLDGQDRVGFAVGPYDAGLPLVIDPVLSYSTYLGGSGADNGKGVAVDASGNAYVTGDTASTNFPTTTGAQDTASNGSTDVFVAKLNPAGTALVYATYLGGSGADAGYAIAVDASGNAYVTGASSSTNFPATSGAYRTIPGGSGDAFVAKLNATGSALVYATYLGGSSGDHGTGIAVDDSGNAYITGETASTNFPTTAGAFQTAYGGSFTDGFAAKLNATGSALAYGTFMGGNSYDNGSSIAVDASGNAYVAGTTGSGNFATTAGAFQRTSGGSSEAFVVKLNSSGGGVYSTLLGGSDFDYGNAIAVDGSGNAYVAGEVRSTNFPVTAGAFQRSSGGSPDAYVAKLNGTGSALVYSTYLGGADYDYASGIAVDASGVAHVAGSTASGRNSTTPYPTTPNAYQTTPGTPTGQLQFFDAFVTKLNTSGSGLIYSTYLGGSADDHGTAVAVDAAGNIYVTGDTHSSNFPATTGAKQTTTGGGSTDVFVARIAKTTPALTATAGGTVVVGGTLTATASLSGAYSPTGTITFSLFDPSGAEVTAARKSVTVTGNTAYTYPLGYTPTVGGVYKWQATYNGDTNNFTATSGQVSETANQAPAVTAQPAGRSTNAGLTVTFAAAATGYPAPAAQWQVSTDNGTTFTNLGNAGGYSGVTTGTLTITGATGALHNNQYRAVFTNGVGAAAPSTAATLRVDTVTSPADAAPDVGGTATFTALSTFATDTVQWQVSTDNGASFTNLGNAGVYSGATTRTLTATGVTAALNGARYRAVFTNPTGSLTTAAAALAVQDVVTANPQDRAANAGQTVAFTAASGYPTDTVRWYVSTDAGATFAPLTDGGVYTGTATGTLTLTGVPAALTGAQFKALFTTLPSTPHAAPLWTSAAFLTVDAVTAQPANQRYAAGQTVTFTAASASAGDAVRWYASTDGGATYQPLADAAPYGGTATRTLAITGATAEMASNAYKAVFTNAAGSFGTNPAALIPATVWDSDTAPNTVPQGAAVGQTVGVTAAADLGPELTFRLTDNAGGRFAIDPATGVVTVANGTLLNARTAASHTIAVEARDGTGRATSAAFTVAVTSTPPGTPADTDPAANTATENAPAGAPVGITALAADPNPVTYALTDDAGGRFAINPTTGVVTVANGALLSYDTAASHTITVRATGFGGTSSRSFTVNVAKAAGPGVILVGGFSLVNAVVTGASVVGDATLPLAGAGKVRLSGTVTNGQYRLTSAALTTVSVAGYAVGNATFTLTNDGLTLAGTASFPVLGAVTLSGAVRAADDYTLGVGGPPAPIGGFPVTAATVTPGTGGLGLSAQVTLPVLGGVGLTGTIQAGGGYAVTATLPAASVYGATLTGAAVTLTNGGLSLAGNASLPAVGTVHLAGSYQNGQYALAAGIPDLTLGGVPLTGAAVSLTPAGVGLTATAALPVIGTAALQGTLQDASHYSLTATLGGFTLGGFGLTAATATLSPAGVGVTGTATLPLVGAVALGGTIQGAANYTLAATVPTVRAGGFTLSGMTVTLSGAGVGLSGTATLPVVGSVPLTGRVADDAHYSLTYRLPADLAVGGYALSGVDVTLAAAGLRLRADATLPVVGTVRNLQGTVTDATHYSLTVPVPAVGVGQFTLSGASVTVAADGGAVGLTVGGTVTLPLFGAVSLTGGVDPAGRLSVSRTLPDFALPGGAFKVKNTVLTLYPDHVHAETDLSVLGVADAHFAGDVNADGTYELDASADLTIAGFQIPKPAGQAPNLRFKNGQLDLGFDYNLPGLGAFLPSGNSGVTFGGTYSPDGNWSLTATANYTFTIGPVVVTSETVTLTPTSLRLGAHGSVADLGSLAQGDVSMTIYRDGTFEAAVDVDSSVAGFSLGKASVTFGDHNPARTFVARLHGVVTIPAGPNVTLDGYWDSRGKYDFRGTAGFGIGSLTLANAQFAVSNLTGPPAFTFTAGCDFGAVQAAVSGTFVLDGRGGFTTTAHAAATVLQGLNVSLDGYLDSRGNYDFTGEQALNLGPLHLTKATFGLSNTKGFTFANSWDYLGLYKGSVGGHFGTDSQGLVATVDADGTVLGSTLHLHGEVHGNGAFDLRGDTKVKVGPLDLATAAFVLNNSAFSFAAHWDYLGAFSGSVGARLAADSRGYVLTVHADGQVFGQSLKLDGTITPSGYDLKGKARIGLGPLDLSNAAFRLSSGAGFTFSDSWNVLGAFTGSVTATVGSGKVHAEGTGTIFGSSLKLVGDITDGGRTYDLSGHVGIGYGPLTLSDAKFRLSSGAGFTFSDSWNVLGVFTGSVSATVTSGSVHADGTVTALGQTVRLTGDISNGGRTYDLAGHAAIGFGPLTLSDAKFHLSPAGFTFSDHWDLLGVFSGDVSAAVGKERGGYFVRVDAAGAVLGQTLTANLKGDIHSDGRFALGASANLTVAGLTLTSVGLRLDNTHGATEFTFAAGWDYPLFSGRVEGTIGSGGHVAFHGVAGATVAGFRLAEVHAGVDLDPGRGHFSVDLTSRLDVYVATVDFGAHAVWSAGAAPALTFTGTAAIGGALSKILQGSASFTIGTTTVAFDGHLGIPNLPISFDVHAHVNAQGQLAGLPGLDRIPGLADLQRLAGQLWHSLGAAWADVAGGLNHALGVADTAVSDLLKGAGATADEMKGALKGAFGWGEQQVSAFFGAAGGVVSGAVSSVGGYLTGKKHFHFGVPQGALVFFDVDRDGLLDPGEPWGYTTSGGEITFRVPAELDADGSGALDDADGQWVIEGGTDLSTGLPLVGRAAGPASWAVVTPLTTLAAVLAADHGFTLPGAVAQVLRGTGLPAGLDLTAFDPVAETLAGNPTGPLVEAAHARVEDTAAMVEALFRAPGAAGPDAGLAYTAEAVIAELVGASAGVADLGDPATVLTVIHMVRARVNTPLADDLAGKAAGVIAAVNRSIDAITVPAGADYLMELARVKRVAQGPVAADLAAAAAGSADIDAVVAADTGDPLAARIAATTTPPVVSVPLPVTAAATSPAGARVEFAVYGYDLAGRPLTASVSAPSGGTFAIGTTDVLVSVTDAFGNTTTATFPVTVRVTTPPTLTLPADLVVQATTEGGADVTLPAATATDPVDPNPVVAADHGSGFFPVGTTTVYVTATDAAGNVSTGTYTVTVLDTTPPALTLPPDLAVEATGPGGAAVVLPSATAVDAADPAPVVAADHGSGFFPVGTTTVYVTATDAAGNVSTGSFTVTVADTTPPALTLPPDLAVEATGPGGALVALPNAIADDAVDVSPVVVVDHGAGFFPVGTTTVRVTATDAAGNVSTGTYTVTVLDTTAPALTLPPDLVVEATGPGGAAVALPTAAAVDAADPAPVVTADHGSGLFPIGVTAVTVTATDAAGNVSTGTYTVTVLDTTAPALTLPPDLVVEADAPGGALVALPAATATDAADPDPLVGYDRYSGYFPLGTTTVRVTARDASGNVSAGTFIVRVVSTTPPTLAVPADLVVEAAGPGGVTVALPGATAASVADPAPVVTTDHVSGPFPVGVTTVHVTATDASGNAATGTYTVTVVDTTPPVLAVPPDVVVNATSAAGAVVALPAASAADAVDPNPAVTYDHPAGLFPVGTTLVTVSATDSSGNTTRRSFTVTVNPAATAVGLTAESSTSSTYGDLLRFTVVVTSTAGAAIPDGAAVTLMDASDGGAAVATGTLLDGSVTLAVSRLNAGTHLLFAAYGGDNLTAAGQSGTLTQVVARRALSVRAVTNDKGYDGTTAAAATPVVVGLQSGDAVTGLAEAYADPALGVGKTLIPSGTVVDGNGGNNYTVTYVSNLTGSITRGTPVITWVPPADIVYGTPLGAAQLNAAASTAGTFTYSVTAGTVLHAGAGQALTVTFTPFDAADYTTATASVTVNVLQATPVVTWATPADIVYGTPLGAAELNAAADVAGAFTYSVPAGAVLHAGGQVLTVTFSPAGPDYAPVTRSVTLTVRKATPVVTWATPADIVYGTPLGTAQLNAAADVPGSFTYSRAAGAVLHAGVGQPLGVVFTPDDATDYETAAGAVVITVTPAALTITADARAMVYGGTLPVLTATFAGLVNGDTPAAVAGLTLSTVPAASHAGTYAITAGGGIDPDYTIRFVSGVLTIGKAALTVTAADAVKVYDRTAFAGGVGVTFDGFVLGDTPAALGGTLVYGGTAQGAVNAGAYAITAGGLASGDYAFDYRPGGLTVRKAAAAVAVAPLSVTYDGLAHPTAGTVTGVGGEDLGAAAVGYGGGAAPADAGEYTATGSFAGNDNYEPATGQAVISVAKAATTTAAYGGSFGYDGTTHAGGSAVVAGAGVVTGGAVMTYTGDRRNAGTYTVIATYAGDANHLGSSGTAAITIIPKAVGGAFTAASRVYDGTRAAEILTRALSGVVAGDEVLLSGGVAAFDARDAGTAKTVTGTAFALAGAQAGNYTLAGVAPATADVTPKPLAGAVTAADKVYDGNRSAVITGWALDGVVDGDTVGYVGGEATFDTRDVGTGKPVTAAGLSLAGPDAGNYVVNTTATTSAAVTARPVVVAAEPAAKLYGDEDPALTYRITPGSVLDGDGFAGALARDPGQGAGTYAIRQGTLTLGTNYDLRFAGAILTVTPRPVAVAAEPAAKVYGDADPALTYRVTAGTLAFADRFTGALERDAGEGVGSYTVRQGALALSGDYDLRFTAATLTVTKARLTVLADDVSRTYGDANPPLTATYTGFVRGETLGTSGVRGAPVLSTDAAATSPVARYTITAGAGTLAADNYDFVTADGVLTVDKARLDIFAPDVSRAYGAANPSLAGTLSGAKNGESFAVSGTTTAGTATPVGRYAVVPGVTGDSLSNYEVVVHDGTLTVEKAVATVRVTGYTGTYDGRAHGAGEAVVTGVNGETFVPVLTYYPGTPTGTPLAGLPTGAGEYTVVAAFDSPNYEPAGGAATIRIDKKRLAVAADATQVSYGDPLPAFTAGYDGFVAGEGPAALGGAIAFTGPATSARDAGTYAVTPGGLTSANYDIVFVGGTLTVTPRPVAVAAEPAAKVYGDADPALTYRVTAGTLAFADRFTGGLERDAGEGVGSYTVRPGTLALGPNYALAFTGADLTVTPATATITVTLYAATYDGNAHAATGTVRGVKGEVLAGLDLSRTAHTDAGMYADAWTFADPAGNYLPAAGVVDDVIRRADAAVAVRGFTGVYDGTAHGATGFASGAKGEDLGALLDLGAGFTAVPGGPAHWAFAGNRNYNPASGDVAITITRRTVVGSFAAAGKVYDGTVAATVLARSAGAVVAGDAVWLTGGTAAFGSKTVGTGKAVTLTGATLTGAAAGNYTLGSVADAAADITPKALTVTAAGTNRGYDGTTAAAVTLSDDRVAGDALTVTYAAAAFRDKNAGTAKPVDVSGVAVGGADAGNYTFGTSATAAATITPRAITVTAGSDTRDYDGTRASAATPTMTWAGTGSPIAPGDAAGFTQTFDAPDAGTRTLSAAGAVADGNGGANYAVTFGTAAGVIRRKTLTGAITAADRDYNGTTAATVAAVPLAGVVGAEDVYLVAGPGAFDSKDAGTRTATAAIGLGGAGAGNYALSAAAASAPAAVRKVGLTVTADDKQKVFGQAVPALTYTITGFIPTESLATSGVTGAPALATTATATSPVGAYDITIGAGTLAAGNYAFTTLTPGTVVVGAAGTGVTVDPITAVPLRGADGLTLTARVSVTPPGAGSPTGVVTFQAGPVTLGTAAVGAGGVATLTLTAAGLAATLLAGGYTVSASYGGDAAFAPAAGGAAPLSVVAPVAVQGMVYVDFNDDGQVDFNEGGVANVNVTLTGTDDLGRAVNLVGYTNAAGVYEFTNLRPSNAAGYTVTEAQPAGLLDGRDTLGTIGGVYVGAAGDDVVSGLVLGSGARAENYNFGERPPAAGAVGGGQTAGIGFWQNKNGQALIRSLNGGGTTGAATQLGRWLAATFPNLYGALAGRTNAEVAEYYRAVFAQDGKGVPGGPPKADAQVLATALAVYVTNRTLAGTAAAAYGFTVTEYGVGVRTYNVGSNGAAFGVANNAAVSVMNLLLAADDRSKNGLLDDRNGDGQMSSTEAGDRTAANDVFGSINALGGV